MTAALPQLPFPVYFICKNRALWSDVMEGRVPPRLEDLHDRFRDARDSWSTQPYIQLKQRGLDVHLVPELVPGKICIVTYDQLIISERPYQSYVVCCRHDRGIPRICEQTIVQNKDNVFGPTDHYLPHWPQPFIEPRDPARGTRVERVSYKGRLLNLAEPFRSPDFLSELKARGFELAVSPEEDAARVRDSRDYTAVDVVLAVRNCTEYNLSIKPPSKLLNAWIAGCPALLGPESAYQQLRKSELDYFEVRSPQDIIDCLEKLRQNPDLYRAMVENGHRRAEEFSLDNIARQWRDLLAGPIADGYRKWCEAGPISRHLGRPLRFGVQALQHRVERKRFKRQIFEGPRLFPDEPAAK